MFRKRDQHLETEVAGLVFPNPAGVPYVLKEHRYFKCFFKSPKAGFLVLMPPRENILPWIKSLKSEPDSTVLAVDIHSDIVRTFSLVYDFADLIIVDPDSDQGIGAADISDTQQLLDELVSLRLCYEHYTPVFLHLSHGISHEELEALLGTCQLNGLDGVVAPNLAMLGQIREMTLGRIPVACMASTPEDALHALENQASLVILTSSKGLNKLLNSLENKQIV